MGNLCLKWTSYALWQWNSRNVCNAVLCVSLRHGLRNIFLTPTPLHMSLRLQGQTEMAVRAGRFWRKYCSARKQHMVRFWMCHWEGKLLHLRYWIVSVSFSPFSLLCCIVGTNTTQHLNVFLVISGDFNPTSLSAALPIIQQFVIWIFYFFSKLVSCFSSIILPQ